MKILKFIDIKDKTPILDDKVYYVLHKREEIFKVFDIFKDFKYDFDYSITARINDNFIEASLFYKEKPKFNNIKVLREVKCPYVKEGKPRGWFKGKNDEPVRWTGISNIFYLKGENAESAMSSLLYALSSGEPDLSWYFYEAEDENTGEKFFGFHPLKREGKELI